MTLRDLIDTLQALADDGYEDAPVRLAFQPNWPLAFDVGNITVLDEDAGDVEPDDDVEDIEDWDALPAPPERSVVWIADGGHPDGVSPYAPRDAFGR